MKWLRLRLNKWLVIVLVVALFVMLIQSYTLRVFARPSLVEIGGVNQLNCLAESKNNSAEVDGLIFETVMLSRVIPIPANHSDAMSVFEISLKITNGQQNPVRFSRYNLYNPLAVRIFNEDNQLIRGGSLLGGILPTYESDFPLVLPGESVSFSLEGKLFWQSNQLLMEFLPSRWPVISFVTPLTPGNYHVCFSYYNNQTAAEIYLPEQLSTKTLQDFWIGLVTTPSVQFRLR